MKPLLKILSVGVMCLLLAGHFPVSALEQTDKTLSPYFYVEKGESSLDHFPLKTTDVKAQITGVVAHVTVNQVYANTGAHPINARYIFPASTRAAVHGMTMTIGEKVIRAQVKEKQAAQKEFDEAKKTGKSASLLKQHRPNVFSMNVANILPGDEVKITLSYTELLVPRDNTYCFVYPTVVGPRYSEQKAETADDKDKWVANPYLKKGKSVPATFSIEVLVSAGMPIQEVVCTSHKADIRFDGLELAGVSLPRGQSAGNRDFILNYRLAGDAIASGLQLHEGEDENFFLLTVQPPTRVVPEMIPAREYIFIVDVSGSMNGFPLNTAKQLLSDLIGNLWPKDRFNVILFAGSASLMSPVSVPADRIHTETALALIDRQRGGGGTRLYNAVKKGLSLPYDDAVSRSMIIITDGYISAENEVFRLIHGNLNRANVFAFGIGSSVNRFLIEGMAKAGRGEPFIVTKPSEAAGAAKRLQEHIAAPVLTGIKMEMEGFDAYSVEPSGFADLLGQRPLVVFGKYRGKPEGTLCVTGMSGTGKFEKTINVALVDPAPSNKALSYLWARQRIALLSDHHFSVDSAENRLEVTNLGLTYNLLTRYTSFIAVCDEIRNPKGDAKDVKQPLPLPLHVSNLAMGGGLASVPEPGMLLMLVLLGVAAGVGIIRKVGRG